MEAIIPGEKIKLRRDVLEYVSIGEWEFCGIKNERRAQLDGRKQEP